MKTINQSLRTKIQVSAFVGMLLVAFTGTSVVAQSYEIAGKRSQAPLSQNGNVGGGGNTIANQLADARRIELVINQTKWFTYYLLNDLFRTYYIEKKQKGIKAWLEQEKNTWPAWQALFDDENGKENLTVLGEVKQANIEIRRDRPCDYQSEHKEASADRKSRTICFSISEILGKKHVNAEIEKKIVALFMHELTHLMGLEDESIAKSFQTLIETRYPKINFIGTDYLIQELIWEASNREDVLGQDLAEFARLSVPEKCWKMGFHLRDIIEIVNSDELKGRNQLSIGIFDPIVRAFSISTAILTLNASRACSQFKDDKGVPLDKMISVYQYLRPEEETNKPPFLPDEKRLYEAIGITGTKLGDFEKAKNDLMRARDFVRAAERRLRQYPRMDTMNYSW